MVSKKKKPLLVPEMVPGPLWGRSAFRMLGQRVAWTKKIRPDALAEANNSCSFCRTTEGRMICHDKWQYNDEQAIATLVGFEIHCAMCDAVTHLGRAAMTGPPEEALLAALNHLCRVNECLPEVAEQIVSNALSQWKNRNKKKWTVKVQLALVARYPELAALPDFMRPPRIF